ncbi:hypothetical protein PA25_28220 [Pseudoalteromonas sp. A25]|uniref:hypothetical protein n=1 Tax=Pseudoalteromonas sp. A25 TaxID=116092 RepID=UPI001260BE63|nr:hypothetical protein [Pseudoalteromonas sp. A25]BBN82837.1 hypothetical protein PA25_28220 [Pseudoalteromonas sp. A25]
MKLKWVVVLACFFVVSCKDNASTAKPHIKVSLATLLQRYDEQLNQLHNALYNEESREKVVAYSDELYATAQTVIAIFTERRPMCADYFSQLLVISEELRENAVHTLYSNTSIQSNLPQFQAPICYHLKELLVQPIILLSYAQQKGPNSDGPQTIQIDMIELQAHIAQVKHSLVTTAHL